MVFPFYRHPRLHKEGEPEKSHRHTWGGSGGILMFPVIISLASCCIRKSTFREDKVDSWNAKKGYEHTPSHRS